MDRLYCVPRVNGLSEPPSTRRAIFLSCLNKRRRNSSFVTSLQVMRSSCSFWLHERFRNDTSKNPWFYIGWSSFTWKRDRSDIFLRFSRERCTTSELSRKEYKAHWYSEKVIHMQIVVEAINSTLGKQTDLKKKKKKVANAEWNSYPNSWEIILD